MPLYEEIDQACPSASTPSCRISLHEVTQLRWDRVAFLGHGDHPEDVLPGVKGVPMPDIEEVIVFVEGDHAGRVEIVPYHSAPLTIDLDPVQDKTVFVCCGGTYVPKKVYPREEAVFDVQARVSEDGARNLCLCPVTAW